MGIEYSKFNESDGINQMKNMFVVSSRAREYLIILFCSINIKDQPVMPDILSIFHIQKNHLIDINFLGY